MESKQNSKVDHSHHYDENYFHWQKNIGAFGAWANSSKFTKTIKKDDIVVDFGCGGGFLLNYLQCGVKIGIEPNASAVESIKNNGIKHFFNVNQAISELGEGTVDVIISNHALEHTLNPLQEIKDLYRLLRIGGTIHFFVPCDTIQYKYNPLDINNHLFSWSPQNLGNLFREGGYEILIVKPYVHKWPPFYRFFARFGRLLFDIVCVIYARLERTWFQVEIKATKLQ